MGVRGAETSVSMPEEIWAPWPVHWGAAWAGALGALTLLVITGLIGIVVGAHQVGTGAILKWSDVSLAAVVFSILGAFLSFAAGGWIAGKIAGMPRAEPAMLHGAISYLLAVPLVLALIASRGQFFPGWFGTLMASTEGAADAALAARNAALAGVTVLLLGLVGAVIGGWIASGEAMTFTYYRTRETVSPARNLPPSRMGRGA